MWYRLTNLFFSVKTYKALAPDPKIRQQVNRNLYRRPALDAQNWFKAFYEPQGIARPIATFAYTHLQKYSGLEFAKVLPTDRLYEDLHWIEVCGFDWELVLCEDFWQEFSIDISCCLHCYQLSTIEELVKFLNQQVKIAPQSSS
ncbi:MAG: hypothetical protein Kow00121_00280 [Elainellaceae cyanobacterium]